MRVILPFVLNGQTLEKGKSFPKKVVAGSKDCLVVKVSGIPDGSVATAYFKQSWDNEKVYDLSFVGDECVIDEYITTLPSVVNEYVDYVVSFSVVVFGGDGQRLTTDPFKIVLNKSNYSDTTENTPEIPESQYVQLTREFADLKRGFNELGEKFDDLSNSVSNADVVYNKPTGTNLLDYDAVSVQTESPPAWRTGYIPVKTGDVLSYQQCPDDVSDIELTAGVVTRAYYCDKNWKEVGNEAISTATFTIPDIDGVAYVFLQLAVMPNGNLAEAVVRGAEVVGFAEFTSTPYIRPDRLPEVVGGTDGAVLYTPQELTEEQKAQARANIGAGTGEGGGSIPVDDHLDPNSTNPVQNKVVTAEINAVDNRCGGLANQVGEMYQKVYNEVIPTLDKLETDIGDIETALDSIIAMQNAFINPTDVTGGDGE